MKGHIPDFDAKVRAARASTDGCSQFSRWETGDLELD